MNNIQVFCIFIGIFALADFISIKTKAWLPSLFTIAVISVVGYWSEIIPRNFFELTGISVTLVYVIYYFQLVNMGALIGLNEMKKQWRVVLIAVSGLIGIVIGSILVVGPILGFEYAIAGAPPLSGGIVAYEIVREATSRMGRNDLVTVAIAIFVLQNFIGYPLTSFLLKRESIRLKNKGLIVNDDVGLIQRKKLIPEVPSKYNTTNLMIFKLSFIGVIGIFITNFINNMFPASNGGDTISRYVILLILGVLFNEIGFLDTAPVKKSEISGFQNVVIIGFSVIAGLSTTTPEILYNMIAPTMLVIISGLMGMGIISIIIGKYLGFSKEMSFAVALTALYGYPGTEILSKESVNVVAENEEEYECIVSQIMPKMIIGGFTTVTFGSVFLASILINFL